MTVHPKPLQWKPAAVLGLVAAGWLVTVAFSLSGRGAIVRHDQLITGSLPLWQAAIVFLAGWQVMLWAMMVPPSLGAIMLPRELRDGLPFTSSYLLLWSAFGLAIFVIDVGVHATVNRSPWLALHPWVISGSVLVVAGAFQTSDLKSRYLQACRHWMKSSGHGLRGARASFAAGLDYALICLGANWALMLLAFALGAVSLPLMAAITALMVWEATEPGARTLKVTGFLLIAAGLVVVAGPLDGLALWSAR